MDISQSSRLQNITFFCSFTSIFLLRGVVFPSSSHHEIWRENTHTRRTNSTTTMKLLFLLVLSLIIEGLALAPAVGFQYSKAGHCNQPLMYIGNPNVTYFEANRFRVLMLLHFGK
jgi:hypothetical protein